MSNPMTPDPEKRRRSRASLVMMASIAFVPLFLAYAIFYYFPTFIPSTTTNRGELITPPISTDEVGLTGANAVPRGIWTLMTTYDTACGDRCRKAIYLTRQVNIALGKDASRVQTLLLAGDEQLPGDLEQELSQQYALMLVRHVDGAALRGVLPAPAGGGQRDGTIYLIDPNGNLMMFYTFDQTGEDMLKDLKHLLKISNIG